MAKFKVGDQVARKGKNLDGRIVSIQPHDHRQPIGVKWLMSEIMTYYNESELTLYPPPTHDTTPKS
jgi:hypothetical protein